MSEVPHPLLRFGRCVTVERQHEAREHVLVRPQDAVVVERGHIRSAVMLCPCGCRDVLVINLDPAAGPAWRYRLIEGRLTLLPSVWREDGCKSHFVLWDNSLYWCGQREEDTDTHSWPDALRVQLREWWRAWRRLGRGRKT